MSYLAQYPQWRAMHRIDTHYKCTGWRNGGVEPWLVEMRSKAKCPRVAWSPNSRRAPCSRVFLLDSVSVELESLCCLPALLHRGQLKDLAVATFIPFVSKGALMNHPNLRGAWAPGRVLGVAGPSPACGLETVSQRGWCIPGHISWKKDVMKVFDDCDMPPCNITLLEKVPFAHPF